MFKAFCGSILALVCCTISLADEDPLQALGERYEAQQKLHNAAMKDAKTDEQYREVFEKLDPRNVLVEDFLAVERLNRGNSAGMSVLYHLMRHAMSVGDPDCAASLGRVKAIQIAREHYLEHPDLHFLLAYFAAGSFVPEGEGLLEDATKSPHKHVRAAARYQLARFLANEALIAELFGPSAPPMDRKGEHPALAEMRRKMQEQVSKLEIKPAEKRKKALRVIEELVAEDSDSLQTILKLDGPGNLRVSQADPDSLREKLRTYADLSAGLRFELEHLQPGQVAPDITGEDVAEDEFNLRDYRGRVVLLIFSANWCGPCKAMYLDLRKLQAELADSPFAILAVMGDREKNTVNQDTESGAIRWRTWFDGDNGPIATKWNVQSWPTLYLIDHRGVIHNCRISRSYEDLRTAIDPLLAAQQADPESAEQVRTHLIPDLPFLQNSK